MKLTVWVRGIDDTPNGASIRTDVKPESRDTPAIQRFIRQLEAAINSMRKGEEE